MHSAEQVFLDQLIFIPQRDDTVENCFTAETLQYSITSFSHFMQPLLCNTTIIEKMAKEGANECYMGYVIRLD